MASKRSYTPPEAGIEAYRFMAGALGFDRSVIVQPSVYGTDNRCTRDAVMAYRDSWRGIAVVAPGISETTLADLHSAGFRGIRVNLLFKGGVALDAIERLAEAVEPYGWHIQFLLDGRNLEELTGRLLRLPVDIVIDHMGHLPASAGTGHPGFIALLRLLREGRCWVKLSGPYRISGHQPPYRDVLPLAHALVKTAPERLVFGTDWPHPAVSTVVPRVASLLDLLALWAPDPEVRHGILVTNPEKLYNFPPAQLSGAVS